MCFVFYAETEDGRQKLQANTSNSLKSGQTIALYNTVFEINMFFHLTLKFKMAAKMAREQFF